MKTLLAEKDDLTKGLQNQVKEKEQEVQQEIELRKQRDGEVSTFLKRIQDYEKAAVYSKDRINELEEQLEKQTKKGCAYSQTCRERGKIRRHARSLRKV